MRNRNLIQLVEGNLAFSFPAGWDAIKYDDSAHYRRHFQSFAGGSKAVDFVAFGGTSDELWLIQVKDYRFMSV